MYIKRATKNGQALVIDQALNGSQAQVISRTGRKQAEWHEKAVCSDFDSKAFAKVREFLGSGKACEDL
jgi:hypothetical protein